MKNEKIRKNSGKLLEKYQLKYGIEKGLIKYNQFIEKKKYIGTLNWFIDKYGLENGTLKYKEKNEKCSGSLNSFKKRYGDEIGGLKYNEFRKKCAIKDEIKNDPNSKYNNREFDTTLDYWLKRCDGDINIARQKLKERQNMSSLSAFQNKYGIDEGLNQYIKVNKLKALNLENFQRLYGEEEGKIHYYKFVETCRYSCSLNWFIEKYGNIEGEKLYELHLKKILPSFINGMSKISTQFINDLLNLLNEQKLIFNKIYYGNNEYMFYMHMDNIKIIKPDFYIKDINLVIEFYGDFWHYNPNIYNNKIKPITKQTETKWDFDQKRLNLLKEKYKCDVLIVWELDYKNKKEEILNYLINKIKEKNDK